MEQSTADMLLTDDAEVRAAASLRGIAVAGTVGVLIEARRRGIITEALPAVLELRRLGQWMSDELIQTVRDDETNPPN